MAERKQLMGYLVYKPGGTFSRLKSSKRHFYVLDDRHWCLFFYRSEEDFQSSRQPLGSIALSEAAISLAASEDSHQFIVHSEGKEHILTAESHRAMMTWALALQTKRDAWDKMITLGTKAEEFRVTYTDDQQKAIKSTDKPIIQGRKQSLQLNGGAHEALRKMVSVSWEKRRNSTLADIGLLRHSEVPKPETEAKPKSPSPSPQREPSPRQCDPITEDPKESSPETESASESDRLAAQEVDDEDNTSPLLRLSDTRNFLGTPSSDSDEAESRLTVLQNELISVKCELAKCLNRENICKATLETKEAELQKLKQEYAQVTKKEVKDLRQKLEMLQNRNRFLNDEIQKLSRMLQQEQFRNHSKHLNLQEMSAEVDQLKRDYVFLLQSCIRITCTDGPEMMELYMYGEKRHKQRVFTLLEEARRVDPSLPNLEGMSTSLCHVDSLGFKHLFVDKSLILHYVCRQLHRHYSTQLRSHERHVAAWRRYLKKHPDNILRPTNELKTLVRRGIPEQLRSRVWSALYRIKIRDLKEAKGAKYFENLCSKAAEAELLEAHKRQISLDLLRTMPNNVNFCDRGADGIQKLQAVLHAFCLHNPKLGYCQGMNFLVGMMLLFVDAEDAFWCLVAIVERYFPYSYFDQNLIGAQADQELLKELLRSKLPKISSHLAALDIELSTVTLNWFLSLFIDAVPIETLLRIWDCFLLEGPKVLYRFSLAVLLMQEEAILAKHDTVSIMRQLKAAAKLCFDVDGLISAAFEELEPFPKREELWNRRAAVHNVLLEKAKKKERELNALRERERMMAQVELEGPHNHLIECAAVWGKDKVWLCYGHHHGSRVSMIHCQESIMYRLHIEFESRVMCMHAPNDDTMLFGTYSRFVHAYHTISRKKMWEICLNSCVLSLCSHQRDGVKQVFAGLADGTLAVVENVQGRLPKPEVFYVVIGSSPVTCLQLVGRRLWCACGPSVMILSARTLDLLDQFQTSSNGLDYIYKMVYGEQGVWITLRGSSILQLWDPHTLTCRLLYDVRDNYSTRTSKVDEAYTNHARITCVLPLDNSALVGTADGTLVIYDVVARKSPSPSAPSSPRPPGGHESGHAKQIQERLQKLLMEQQLLEGEDPKTRCGDSPNLTPSSNVSRRESSASSMDSKDSGSDAGGDEEESIAARRSPSLLLPDPEKSPRLYGRGLRKPSYIAPIEEENVSKVEEEEETISEIAKKEEASVTDNPPVETLHTTTEGKPATTEAKAITTETKEITTETKTITAEAKPITTESKSITTEEQSKETPSDVKRDDSEPPTEEQKRKLSEPQEFSRFRHVDAGDLVSAEGGDKVVSALEFQTAELKAAKKRYQSLSAEDIPTWVAQEKPQPVISARGDVTFEYKSRLPSIKAFIRKEANELATFLKGQQQQEPEQIAPISKGRNYPLFSIRPPTIDLSDHQFFSKHFPEESIQITVDSTPPLPLVQDKPPPPAPAPAPQIDSRRSSGVPASEELPPSYLASDEDFLSTVQFNDLLQLQDWTRTSRKGSDTASNVSFGSTEVPFAFELHLKEMIKISDKPIRSLLQAYCDDDIVIVSCAGYYGDDEAVLKWIREGDEKLWTNDPIVEVCPFTHAMKPSPYARSRLPRRASIATTALASDVDFVGRASIESGIAKVQHLLSRVSDRT